MNFYQQEKNILKFYATESRESAYLIFESKIRNLNDFLKSFPEKKTNKK